MKVLVVWLPVMAAAAAASAASSAGAIGIVTHHFNLLQHSPIFIINCNSRNNISSAAVAACIYLGLASPEFAENVLSGDPTRRRSAFLSLLSLATAAAALCQHRQEPVITGMKR